ncbi:MAG: hypothetical protein BRD45_07035 [Bacteroidetes bacterium QS_8_64_10]|nr:MAG: hypothetical protein BRD45_07035 [Bacteroidetes bacterium QS_8_64_10]
MADLVGAMQPDVVLAPWLLDAPPKHRLANHLLWLANISDARRKAKRRGDGRCMTSSIRFAIKRITVLAKTMLARPTGGAP